MAEYSEGQTYRIKIRSDLGRPVWGVPPGGWTRGVWEEDPGAERGYSFGALDDGPLALSWFACFRLEHVEKALPVDH